MYPPRGQSAPCRTRTALLRGAVGRPPWEGLGDKWRVLRGAGSGKGPPCASPAPSHQVGARLSSTGGTPAHQPWGSPLPQAGPRVWQDGFRGSFAPPGPRPARRPPTPTQTHTLTPPRTARGGRGGDVGSGPVTARARAGSPPSLREAGPCAPPRGPRAPRAPPRAPRAPRPGAAGALGRPPRLRPAPPGPARAAALGPERGPAGAAPGLTFSRKVLGLGPLFLGPYSSRSLSLRPRNARRYTATLPLTPNLRAHPGAPQCPRPPPPHPPAHFCSKAAMRRESRMFSSGSQVLYLPAGGRGRGHGGRSERRRGSGRGATARAPRRPPPPHRTAPHRTPFAAAPQHSLDRPPLPFHQVLDASLKKKEQKRSDGGVWGEARGRMRGTARGMREGAGPAGCRRGPWSAAPRSRGSRLTLRIRRLMMDSAAKTRSPTADSSILLSGTHSP